MVDPAPDGSRRGLRLPLILAAAVVVLALLRAFVVDTYYVAEGDSGLGLRAGDRVLLVHGLTPQRGDLVAVRLTPSPAHPDRTPAMGEGVAGRVVGALARLSGADLGEQSALVRAGTAGQGTISESAAVGVAVLRYWPLSRFGTLPTGPTTPEGAS